MKMRQNIDGEPVYTILSGESSGLTLQILIGGLDWLFES